MATSDLLMAFLPLLFIVGLLYAAMLFLKKYSFRAKGRDSGILNIRVISNKMIMPKKFISVVKIENKLLVLGISENSMALLKEIDSPAVPLEETTSENEKESFLTILKKNFGKR
jgi:flagellar protein FliO/FliZ